MSRTYKAIGINLKATLLGEADRVLTILTKEHGLIRAVAMGARKQNSKMGGRSGLFVVNNLLIAQGKTLDKITQAETLESYPGLGRTLKKLTAGQYLAELVLNQALSEQPQEDLFYLLNEHLGRIERSHDTHVLAHLTHAIFQLLAIAGVAPQVHQCCLTQALLKPDVSDPHWQAGFSAIAGGAVTLEALEHMQAQDLLLSARVRSTGGEYRATLAPTAAIAAAPPHRSPSPNMTINAVELAVFQQLAHAELSQPSISSPVWLALERLLRQYAQYYFDRPIRSAALIDTCFAPELSESP
ncbi:DNA repair protein RecO [Myxacorys almedinensis]|uniref:DNA repair protein RecO n=1 Tax=Myxacorys almedinensis A TaxID=2690445 RepID=A0A8J8CHK8_9CYAN|nr:DNA repair protein RecO [Myxacorys almedinensis]NDJ16833.1 DNA repair protein RecO [Myxacorys almedinensis A]